MSCSNDDLLELRLAGQALPVHRAGGHDEEALHLVCRAAQTMTEVAQEALHQDPRYRAVWLRAAGRAGRIEIGGQVDDARLLTLLRHFAEEWGGIEMNVNVVAAAAARGN